MENQGINKHFNREIKIMIWLLLTPIVIGIIVALLFPYLKH